MQRGQCSAGADFEGRTNAVGAAGNRCPIEIAVDPLYQSRRRSAAVIAIGQRAEAVQRGVGLCRRGDARSGKKKDGAYHDP